MTILHRFTRDVILEFEGADLPGADLRRADLSGADLRGANLEGADLSNTLFTQSTFSENVLCKQFIIGTGRIFTMLLTPTYSHFQSGCFTTHDIDIFFEKARTVHTDYADIEPIVRKWYEVYQA